MSVLGLAMLAVAPSLAAGMASGGRGLLGYLLGAGGAGLNLWAWWLLLGALGRVMGETRNPRGATSVVILSFLLKAPLLFALVYGAVRLGTDAATWCIGGLVLVYFLLVCWALGRS